MAYPDLRAFPARPALNLILIGLCLMLLNGCIWVKRIGEDGGVQGLAKEGLTLDEQVLEQIIALQLQLSLDEIPVGSELPMQLLATTASGYALLLEGSLEALTWQIDQPSQLELQTDPLLIRALAPGSTVITVTLAQSNQQLTAQASITVNDAQLQSLVLQQDGQATAEVSLPLGSQLDLQALGSFSDGSQVDVSNQVLWQTTAHDVLAPSSLTAKEQGVVTLWASLSGIDASPVEVTVLPAAPMALRLTPASLTLHPGTSAELLLEGEYTDGEWRAISAEQISAITNNGLVQWSQISGQEGQYLLQAPGVELGTDSFLLSFDGLEVQLETEVTTAFIERIELGSAIGDTPVLAVGESLELTAKAVYSDGSELDITSQTLWQSDTPSLAAINGANAQQLLAGSSPGSLTLSAEYTDSSGTLWQETMALSVSEPVSAQCGPLTPQVEIEDLCTFDQTVLSLSGIWSYPDCEIYAESAQNLIMLQLDNHSQSVSTSLQGVTITIGGQEILLDTDDLEGNQDLPSQGELQIPIVLPLSGLLESCESQLSGLSDLSAEMTDL